MTVLNNNLTENQINNVWDYFIGGEATRYEKECAVVEFLNSENLTIEECYAILEKEGWTY